jgi:CBS domain-containing protein
MSHYVIDAMSRNPVMVGLDHPARLALFDAERLGVHHVLVTDGGLSVVGMASREELRAAGNDSNVALAMHIGSITIDDQATLEEAEALMDRARVDCLPVTSWDGILHGVITRGDIARARAQIEGDGSGSSTITDPDDGPRCASCGVQEHLRFEADVEVAFCERCLAQSQPPEEPGDELYFTLGGGG